MVMIIKMDIKSHENLKYSLITLENEMLKQKQRKNICTIAGLLL